MNYALISSHILSLTALLALGRRVSKNRRCLLRRDEVMKYGTYRHWTGDTATIVLEAKSTWPNETKQNHAQHVLFPSYHFAHGEHRQSGCARHFYLFLTPFPSKDWSGDGIHIYKAIRTLPLRRPSVRATLKATVAHPTSVSFRTSKEMLRHCPRC